MGDDVDIEKLIPFCVIEFSVILGAVLAIWIGVRWGRRLSRIVLVAVGIGVLVLAPDYRLLLMCTERVWQTIGRTETSGIVGMFAIVVLTITLAGLLAVWVALGRGHWFLRTGSTIAAVGLLALVPAHEMLLILTVQFLVVLVPLMVVRVVCVQNEGRQSWQFALRDLFLFTFVCAILLAIAVSIPSGTLLSWDGNAIFPIFKCQPVVLPWCYYVILGAEAGVLTLLSAWIALGRCRAWKRLVVLFAVFPIACARMGWWLFKTTAFWSKKDGSFVIEGCFPDGISGDELLTLTLPASLLLMVFWLALFRGSRLAFVAPENRKAVEIHGCRRWCSRAARAGLVVWSLALLVPLGWTYWILRVGPIPKVVLPDPNGYTKLVELSAGFAAIGVPKDRRSVWEETDAAKPADYIAFVRQNEQLLAETKAALDLPSCIPLKYSFSDVESLDETDYYFWELGCAFVAAGHACCHQGDYQRGVQWYLDTIRLGRKCYYGGLWYSHWEAGGLSRRGGMFDSECQAKYAIHDMRHAIPAEVRRRLIESLEDLGEEGEPFKVVQRRDRIWQRHALGWWWRIASALAPEYDAWAKDEPVVSRLRVWHRLLIIELALENYRDDHGQYPKKLDELVPKYLGQLPRDPFGGEEFRYRLTENSCLVYSVGPNGQDDGARNLDEHNEIIGDDFWFFD